MACPPRSRQRADKVPSERERAVPAAAEIEALRAPPAEASYAEFRAQLAGQGGAGQDGQGAGEAEEQEQQGGQEAEMAEAEGGEAPDENADAGAMPQSPSLGPGAGGGWPAGRPTSPLRQWASSSPALHVRALRCHARWPARTDALARSDLPPPPLPPILSPGNALGVPPLDTSALPGIKAPRVPSPSALGKRGRVDGETPVSGRGSPSKLRAAFSRNQQRSARGEAPPRG